MRVYDGAGKRVDAETISRPDPSSVAVAIDRTLARGTYTVAWRAISADSDPISGAFVFHVREPGPQPAGIAAQVLEDTPAQVSILFAAARALDYVLLLLAAGGTFALAFVLTGAAPALRRRLSVLAACAAVALVLLVPLEIVLQGAAAGGFGLGEAFDWEIVSAVAGTRFGEYALVRAGLGAALAASLLVLPRFVSGLALRVVQLALAAGLLVTPVASGHASVSGALAFVSDFAHIAAAAAWTGGLAFLVLALVLAREQRWSLATERGPALLQSRRRHGRSPPRRRHGERLPAGAGVAGPLGHDLRPAPAGQDRSRAATSRPRAPSTTVASCRDSGKESRRPSSGAGSSAR